MENWSGITFIYANVMFHVDDLPFSISENMTLRPATDDEIDQFKEHLDEKYGVFSKLIVPFDHEPKKIDNGTGNRTIYVPSDQKRWWVIAFNGSNSQIIDLGKIANLIKPKLILGDTFLYSEPNQQGTKSKSIFGSHEDLRALSDESIKEHSDVPTKELENLKVYYENFSSPDGTLNNVKYSLDLYSSSSGLWNHSTLLTLALFSIIESLIAHKPRLTETLDSITHQIKHKINLLSKKFENKLDYKNHFGEIGAVKVWGKLYGLRSDIAHGQEFLFSGGNSCLVSLENTNLFLDEVVRELLKLSIIEPDLVRDIREC